MRSGSVVGFEMSVRFFMFFFYGFLMVCFVVCMIVIRNLVNL